MTCEDLLMCKHELGCEALVKTKEETLTILQDARGLFFGKRPEPNDTIERVAGIDNVRLDEYRVVAACGFVWQNLPFTLKVAHMWERRLKPRKNTIRYPRSSKMGNV
jgi:hypothetical protein